MNERLFHMASGQSAQISVKETVFDVLEVDKEVCGLIAERRFVFVVPPAKKDRSRLNVECKKNNSNRPHKDSYCHAFTEIPHRHDFSHVNPTSTRRAGPCLNRLIVSITTAIHDDTSCW